MRNLLIGLLVCLNVGLLLMLLLGSGAGSADAQVIGGGTDYMVITARIGSNYDAIFIIDVAQQRLACWKFDRTLKRLVVLGRGRKLTRDFRP